MPWVDKDKCSGCGTCVEECPVDAILMVNEVAEINMDDCIRCGTCHDVCPEEAVRHDSEKIPDKVKANVIETKKFMDACAKYLGDAKEGQKCLNRVIRHFNQDKTVAEKTIEQLESLRNQLRMHPSD
jgi:Fe-S-cluster-containing hydrogenase component 2